MKKNLLFIFVAIISINIANSQTIFSSDFETWENNYPKGWNGLYTGIGQTSLSQSTEDNAGA